MRVPALLPLLLVACAGAASTDDGPTAAAALEAMTTTIQDAVVRRDPAAIGALFAEDAVLHEIDGAVITGREAIQARLATVLPRVEAYALTSQRLEAGGGLAYDAATFQLTLAMGDGTSRKLTGHQLIILRRQPDGVWKVARTGSWSGTAAQPHH